MLLIKAWRVFYADGSTYDSTMGTWAQAPPFGVQCVVYYHEPPYKTLMSGRDVYGYEGRVGEQFIKMGLWMDEEGLHRIQSLALASTMPED